MYTVQKHGDMVTDRIRTGAYQRALERVVRQGDVVVDIGTGTGVFAVFACRLGARRVYGIEPADIVEVARQIVAANGCADRVELIQGMSTTVDLPERADVVVADIRGALPVFAGSLATLADARDRLLRPGGTLLPLRDDLYAAAVTAPDLYEATIRGPWHANAYGLDMSAGNLLAANQWVKRRFDPEQVVSTADRWAELEYAKLEGTSVNGTASLVVERPSVAHGVATWFEATLVEGIGFSSSPFAPPVVYQHLFFPWPEPVEVQAGQRISVDLRADAVGGEYVWTWRTTSPDAPAVAFEQSTFYGEIWSEAKRARHRPEYRPVLSQRGRFVQEVLDLMDGERDLATISAVLADRYPDRFPTQAIALGRVAELVGHLGADPAPAL